MTSNPHIIHSYQQIDGTQYPAVFQIGRDRDGNVILQLRGLERGLITIYGGGKVPGDMAAIVMPPSEWRKFIAASALEPDLWPGCDCDVKQAQAEVGKPHGGPLG